MGVLAFTALGFAAGVVAPSRFTAPVLAIGLMLLLQVSLGLPGRYGWVSPARDSVSAGASVFFGVDPGLAILQIIFLCGVTAVAVSAIAPMARGAGTWARGAAAALTAAGIVAIGAGVALAGTVREQAPQGALVPALHDAAGDQPIRYTPVCDTHSPVPVCVHPAYRSLLSVIAADLAPVTSQFAGLPGMPVRAELVAPEDAGGFAGRDDHRPATRAARREVHQRRGPDDRRRAGHLAPVRGDGRGHRPASRAEPAFRHPVAVGAARSGLWPPAGGRGAAAAPRARGHRRRGPAVRRARGAARRAWLAAHLPAVRAGHLTLAGLLAA